MKNCYSVWLLIAVLVIVMVMAQTRSENMVSSYSSQPINVFKVNQLPRNAKRCSLCNHCRCNIRPVDMPKNPVIYYGGNGEYLVRRINSYKVPNSFHMCAPSTFGGLEPNVPKNQRQCWIGEEFEQDPLPQIPDISCNSCDRMQTPQMSGDPQAVPEVMNYGESLHGEHN